MPDPVIIENRPFMARLLLLFWAAEIMVGLLFMLTRGQHAGPIGKWRGNDADR